MSYFKVRNPLNEKQALVNGLSDIVASDLLGQGFVSEYSVDDDAAASDSVLWTSDKLASEFQTLVDPAVAGDLASLTASGQTQDSGVKVDDAAAASSSVLWTSQKINSLTNTICSAGWIDTTIVPGDNSINLLTCTVPNQNIGGGWALNAFTAPEDGIYNVGLTLAATGNNWNTNTSFAIRVYVGAFTYYLGEERVYVNAVGFVNPYVNIVGPLFLSSGDQVSFQVQSNTGFAYTTKSTFFSWFYIIKQ